MSVLPETVGACSQRHVRRLRRGLRLMRIICVECVRPHQPRGGPATAYVEYGFQSISDLDIHNMYTSQGYVTRHL